MAPTHARPYFLSAPVSPGDTDGAGARVSAVNTDEPFHVGTPTTSPKRPQFGDPGGTFLMAPFHFSVAIHMLLQPEMASF